MIQKLKLLLLLTAVSLAGFSQTSDSLGDTRTSKVILYRPGLFQGSAIGLKVMMNGAPLVKLKNASVFEYALAPGDYNFSIKLESEAKVNLKAEAGKVYYIRCAINMGFWAGRPDMVLVDATAGAQEVKTGNYSQQVYIPMSTTPTFNRLGLTIGGGAGFESIALFKDADGKEVNLSTGGGLTIGVEYGRQITKYFDIMAGFYYHESSLSEVLKNADATFSRTSLVINPSLVIPISDGLMRLKFGPGIAYYMSPEMQIDASKVGSSKYLLKYDDAVSFYGNIVFEANMSDRAAYFVGLKYSNTTYKYNSGLLPYGDSKFIKPNGSGLDFLFGVSYYY